MLLFVKVTPYHATGSRERKFTALPILNFGAGRGGRKAVNATSQPLYPWVRATATIVEKAGWAPGTQKSPYIWTTLSRLRTLLLYYNFRTVTILAVIIMKRLITWNSADISQNTEQWPAFYGFLSSWVIYGTKKIRDISIRRIHIDCE